MDKLNPITAAIVHSALRIHMKLGPGLLEFVYEAVLAHDLMRQGFHVQRQKPISFEFEGHWFQDACRVDLVIDHAVVVEVKSRPTISLVHEKQLLTYLRLMDLRVGLLLNFGAALMKDGIRRVVHRF